MGTDTVDVEDRYMLVTRYVRADGRVITHIYAGADKHYPTRSKAVTAKKQLIKEARERASDDIIDRLIAEGRYEVNVVKVIDL